MSNVMAGPTVIPLIIDGKDIILPSGARQAPVASPTTDGPTTFQGATKELALLAAESSARAFIGWSRTSAIERRGLLEALKEAFHRRSDEIRRVCDEEIHCGEEWAEIIASDALGLIQECASLVASTATGSIPATQGEAYGFIFKEPLGVILGIAPWNAPIILGLRAVLAPITVGNVAILKGSEFSPRVHYLLASLFREAGFPPGVVNFILHRAGDGAEIFEALITHRAVKKCIFTGSTQVGRNIATAAARALKPVLLELGGKNFSIVLDDANLDLAAQEIIRGAFLNNGQICMSTDLVISTTVTSHILEMKILALLKGIAQTFTVISPDARAKLDRLVENARSKGAYIHRAPTPSTRSKLVSQSFIPTIITGLTPDMEFYGTESFGPICGLLTVDSEDDIPRILENSNYGLSASIISTNHYRALKMAEAIETGAVHINSMTVHDEPALPHGGRGESGWGRFGSRWGLEEFLQTKTVTLHQ